MLVAWWPLNGNLDDYSGNGYNLINNGCSISDTGKIGKCYTLTSNYMSNTDGIWANTFNNSEFSISFWIRLNTDSDKIIPILSCGSASTNTYLHILLRNSKIFSFAFYSNDYDTTYKLDDKINEWHHIACIYKNLIQYVYVDGILLGQRTSSSNLAITNSVLEIGKYRGSCNATSSTSLNDVRIYNHALSEKEIKEIYKSLVLHYTFDDTNEEPTSNILEFDGTFETLSGTAGFTNQLGTNGTIEVSTEKPFTGTKSLKLSRKTGGAERCYREQEVLKDKAYTFSAWIYNKTGTNVKLFIQINGNDYTWKSFEGATHQQTGWERLYVTTPVLTSDTSLYMFIYLDDNLSIYVDNIQLEEKDHRTPFTPNNRNININDSSGYNHHGTINNTVTAKIIPNNILGSNCMELDGTNTITTDQIFFDNLNQCHTVSAWLYPTHTTNQSRKILNFNCGYYLTYNTTTRTLMYMNSGTNDHYVYGSTLPTEQWTLVTWVYDYNNKICKVYYNGQLEANSSIFDSTDIPFGMNNSTIFFENYIGRIDDLRIYATALSAEEIKELYESKCSIDRNNNIYVSEFIEDCSNEDNLIYNGDFHLQSKDGFVDNTQVTYLSTDKCENSSGCLEVMGNFNSPITTDYIPININDTYQIDIDIKRVAGTDNIYCCVYCYDTHQNLINTIHINKVDNTNTTLAEDLNTGDTTITLTSASGWNNEDASSSQKYIGICNSYAYQYNRCNDYQNYESITDNIITLASPWAASSYKAGTKVANFSDNTLSAYPFMLDSNASPTDTWMHCSDKFTNFKYSTAYIKIGLIVYTENSIHTANLSFKNLTSHQTLINNKNINITKKGILNADELLEMGLPVRYIKNSMKGSTANSSNHWVEIQAFNQVGINVALDKKVSDSSGHICPYLSDGLTKNSVWSYEYSSSGPYRILDLEYIEIIEKIKLWHFYGDGRAYHNNKVEVSANGTNWITVFDSDIDGEYTETSAGKEIILSTDKVKFRKNGEILANEFIEK